MRLLARIDRASRPRGWMLSLVLCACGPDGGDKTTGTDSSSDTQDTGTSEPTGTTTDTTSDDATDTGTTTGTATTDDTTSDGSASSQPTGQGCENFLPPIMPETLEPVVLDTPFEVIFTVPGLEDNTSWELTGELPPGVEFAADTGTLGGTPTMAGTFSFWLEARPTMDNPDCSTVPSGTMYDLVVSE